MRDINVAITGTLNAAGNTVTFNAAIDKNKLLTIVNTTANVEIYTANDESNGGKLDVSNTVLRVDYDTSSMNDSDLLQVIYEGVASTALASQSTLAAVLAKIIAAPATEASLLTALTFLSAIQAQLAASIAVNPISGMAGIDGGAGATSTRTTRVVLASDGTLPLPAGAATQTTLAAVLAQLQATLSVTQSGAWTITATPPKASSANTPAIVTSGGDVIASNPARKSWGITNLGTNPLFIRMATGASSSVFHFCLAPGVANDDGFGASVSDDIYTGVVSATGTSPRFTVYEL